MSGLRCHHCGAEHGRTSHQEWCPWCPRLRCPRLPADERAEAAWLADQRRLTDEDKRYEQGGSAER